MTQRKILSRREFQVSGDLLFSDGFHVCIDGAFFIRERNATFYLDHELVAWANANRNISEAVFEGKRVQDSDQFILDSIDRTVNKRRERSLTNSANARQLRKGDETYHRALHEAKTVRAKHPAMKLGRVAGKVADHLSQAGVEVSARTIERWIRYLWNPGRID